MYGQTGYLPGPVTERFGRQEPLYAESLEPTADFAFPLVLS